LRSLRRLTMIGGGDNVLVRLSVLSPLKGVLYSLQDRDGTPVDVHTATGRTILFEIPLRLGEGKAGWRFLGEHVRTEGKARRFIYVATGQQAGQTATEWSRRAKIDLPEATAAMIKAASSGQLVLEAAYQGTEAKGGPTCATVKVDWKIAGR
jgi:hypothetical protein